MVDFKDFKLSIGMIESITPSINWFTNVLAHNVNGKKTYGAAVD